MACKIFVVRHDKWHNDKTFVVENRWEAYHLVFEAMVVCLGEVVNEGIVYESLLNRIVEIQSKKLSNGYSVECDKLIVEFNDLFYCRKLGVEETRYSFEIQNIAVDDGITAKKLLDW